MKLAIFSNDNLHMDDQYRIDATGKLNETTSSLHRLN